MDLFYYRDKAGNFGDDLNAWLWDELLPGFRDAAPNVTLVGVGTILNRDLNLPSSNKLVVGSGCGYGNLPETDSEDGWDIRCVRGPKTAGQLGLAPEMGVLDPAMMIPLLPEFAGMEKSADTVIFIPHHSTAERHPWSNILRGTSIEFTSPRGEAKEVISKIAGARLVLAESMHAAILADAFRTPWIPISLSETFNRFKWNDFAQSLDIDLRVIELFPEIAKIKSRLGRSSAQQGSLGTVSAPSQAAKAPAPGWRRAIRIRIERLLLPSRMKKALQVRPTLSDENVLRSKQDRFQGILETIRSDYL